MAPHHYCCQRGSRRAPPVYMAPHHYCWLLCLGIVGGLASSVPGLFGAPLFLEPAPPARTRPWAPTTWILGPSWRPPTSHPGSCHRTPARGCHMMSIIYTLL